ncbi:type I secretion system permease/ATPase [Curvivirga aplysinae]|uniref:type I secretion system permease/ATPase n=1 Tax=Curvivirga aplysinae TaxID=2529852 RepID=UPI001C3FACB0|nr:type I secretion system permease/ATPase [Curvivirga aplysinae]
MTDKENTVDQETGKDTVKATEELVNTGAGSHEESGEEVLLKIRQAILDSKAAQEETPALLDAEKPLEEAAERTGISSDLEEDDEEIDFAAAKTASTTEIEQLTKIETEDEEIDFSAAKKINTQSDDKHSKLDKKSSSQEDAQPRVMKKARKAAFARKNDEKEAVAENATSDEFSKIGTKTAAQKKPDEERRNGERRASPRWHIKPNTGQNDDPLLGCLTILCTLQDRPISANALTAGLPLEEEGHMTPDLFIRAAERAGITARLQKQNLDAISRLTLPCVLLLKEQRAAVLTEISSGGKATILLPEMGAGTKVVSFEELKENYIGYTLFARPEFQFDARAKEEKVENPKDWFWGNIMSSWRLYLEVMMAALLINCFAIASPLFVMNVYDRVVPNFAEETLWVLAIGVTMVFGFDFILKLLRGYLVDVAGKTADTRIAARLFQQMLGMKMADRPQSAGALANSMREFESLREFFTSSTLVTLIDLPFILLFLTIIYVIGGGFIVMVPASIVIIVALVGLLMQMPMKKVMKDTHQEAQQKHAILVEAITGIETIKLAAAESRMQRAWEVFTSRTARSSMLTTRWAQLAMNFSGMSMQMVTVGVVVVGVYLIQNGDLTVGALVACTILSGRALAPLGQIAGIATRFHQAKQALSALDDMMQTPVERPQGRTFVHRPTFTGHIEYKNVGFTYPEAQTEALRNVSFDIQAGEKVGIIGRIGSGKSTVERLMLGLHDPTAGSVMIDGTDTRQVDPADLRRNIGVVPQDVYLFFGSVKENIALGAPYVDDAAIIRAARIAGVEEFASKHPMGLDMPVGERGANLSGGQRQAVAVARALLLDPPILVMDEPTSSMDNTSESRFKSRLGTVIGNKTLVLVTHRGSLMTLVDRLIVMDGGIVVADGPKEAVMEALASGRIQTAKD